MTQPNATPMQSQASERGRRRIEIDVPDLSHSTRRDRFRGFKNVKGLLEHVKEVVTYAEELETEMQLQTLLMYWRFKQNLTIPEIQQRLQFHPRVEFRRTFKQLRHLFEQITARTEAENKHYE